MHNFFWKQISWLFTIPSWIITTTVAWLKWVAENIPQIWILTTKSINLNWKAWNREPIYLKYDKLSYMNAVGLTNPWAEEFRKQLEDFKVPKDKFLLISIFWSNVEEFKRVAEILADKADWFELNVSCPHASWYWQTIGQDFDLVAEIIKEVKKVWKPVIVKPSPNVSPISELVKKCVSAWVDWFCAINTVGPWYYSVDWNPVLTNKVWWMSWAWVVPMWLKVVREIRENSDLPIIWCWWIRWVKDVIEYANVWANYFWIWSSLTWMDANELKNYFEVLNIETQQCCVSTKAGSSLETWTTMFRSRSKTCSSDRIEPTHERFPPSREWQGYDVALSLLKDIDMDYYKITVKEKVMLADDLVQLSFDKKLDVKFWQYVFLWIPWIWEKPFSVFLNDPFTLLVQNVWIFTKEVMNLKVWDSVYYRWPYGKTPEINWNVMILWWWSWVASFWILPEWKNIKYKFIFWARSKDRLPDKKIFEKYWKILIATNDWSQWHKWFVTDFLENEIKEFKPDFIMNCWPKPMINAVEEIQLKYLDKSKIFSSLDRMTKCWVWICGACTDKVWIRTCIDWPFVNPV